jgi:hypothetical protein
MSGSASAHGNKLHVSHPLGPRIIGGQRERFVGWQLQLLFLELIPEGLVDALRVPFAGREQVNDQKVDALTEEFGRLFYKGPEFRSAGFVAGRHDFHDGNHVSVPVPNGDTVGFIRVDIRFLAADQARSRPSGCHRQATLAMRLAPRPGRQFQGQDVWNRPTDALFGKREVLVRQHSIIECGAKRADPLLMKGVKQSRIDAGPVMNRHDSSLFTECPMTEGHYTNPATAASIVPWS